MPLPFRTDMPDERNDSRATSARESDPAILLGLRAGDPRAFEQLFAGFDQPLRRFAYRIVRSREVAAELVQDVFLRVWHGRDLLDIRGDLSAYLFAATRNRALDWKDREHRHRRWVEREVRDVNASVDDVDVTTTHLDHAQQTEALHSAIADALAALPAKRREICRLRWIEGVGPKLIAERLGLSIKTVEVQITRGRKELRARLPQE